MNAEKMRLCFARLADMMSENRERLIELDQQSGDGDLGISMCDGFRAAKEAMERSQEQDLGRLLNHAANSFNEAAPSSLGTILTFGMKGMARALVGKIEAQAQELGRSM